MSSVTQRIKQIKQPYGGYVPVISFEKFELEDNRQLLEENLHAGIIGIVVDYMTRFMQGSSASEAFAISLKGASIINETSQAQKFIRNIKGLDKNSIIFACKLAGYDVCFRSGTAHYKPVEDINPDENTIDNIIIMVERSLNFFNTYGPVTKDGFTFEGGYTSLVNAGDGDFLTADTLWDFKVSKSRPNATHTLQLLMYYLMGIHSIHPEFENISKLGIFNPRLNVVFTIDIKDISDDVIKIVEDEIIGYAYSEYTEDTVHPQEDDEVLLSISDIMETLEISRSKIMKWYKENGLPLRKIKNRYYISVQELYDWLDEQAKKEKRQKIVLLIYLLCMISIVIWAMIKIIR